MQKTILIADDEPNIVISLEFLMKREGFQVEVAADGAAALDAISRRQPDLILLDIMLPKVDGYELLEYLKPMGTPAIFITAKGAVPDRVKGLQLGADDYIVKPFEIVELKARVEAVLRRYNLGEKTLMACDLEINTESRMVSKNGEPVELTLKEYELLVMLVRNRGMALFRETLFERIWGSSFMGETRTLDLHIQRLRKKLGWEDKIKTVYKVGYRLDI